MRNFMKPLLTTLVALTVVGLAHAQAPTPDEELALAALEGLMAQPSERALPIIKKVLAGSQTTLVKQRALFVLSQMDSPEAQQILVQTTRSTDPAMRAEAIRSIGIGGNSKSLDALLDVYKSGDGAVKQDVLQAWLIAGRKDAVYQAAVSAKSEEEARNAIHILGAMGATEELRKLGSQPNASPGLLEAYAISGDLESLRKLATGAGDRSVRIEAVRRIGIIQGEGARTALQEIYASNTDPEFKEAALQGMMIGGDEQGVLKLYRASKSSEEKRALLRVLSTMDGDAALKEIDEALAGTGQPAKKQEQKK
jgi:HEAT repeat protein